MKLIALILFSITLNAWAQIHIVPPIDSANDNDGEFRTKEQKCESLLKSTEVEEKKFVELSGKKYHGEKSFFKAIDKRLMSDSVKKLSEKPDPKQSLSKCSDAEIEILNRIAENYTQGSIAHLSCLKFLYRSQRLPDVKKLIKLNE